MYDSEKSVFTVRQKIKYIPISKLVSELYVYLHIYVHNYFYVYVAQIFQGISVLLALIIMSRFSEMHVWHRSARKNLFLETFKYVA